MKPTVLPIPLHEKNRKLIQTFRETLNGRPDSRNHLELSIWQQSVNEDAEQDLLKELDFKNGPRLPLYFNLHLLLSMLSDTIQCYEDINIEISKDKSRWYPRAHAQSDRLKCCCSHPISVCFIATGEHGDMLIGSECIEKTNFTSQNMRKLKHEITERDMTPEQKEEREAKKQLNKEKREREKAEKAEEEEEEYRMREEERKQRHVEKVLREKEEATRKKKYNLENCICNKCGKHFPNQGKYELCFPCKPKCECGNVITGNFAKCFTCNNPDICISCKNIFNGKGKFKQCYPCKSLFS